MRFDAVCVGVGLVPVAEDSEERVLVAAFAPMDQLPVTQIEFVVKDAREFVPGVRYNFRVIGPADPDMDEDEE